MNLSKKKILNKQNKHVRQKNQTKINNKVYSFSAYVAPSYTVESNFLFKNC